MHTSVCEKGGAPRLEVGPACCCCCSHAFGQSLASRPKLRQESCGWGWRKGCKVRHVWMGGSQAKAGGIKCWGPLHVNVNDDQQGRGFRRVSFRTFPSKTLVFPQLGKVGAACPGQDQVFCAGGVVSWWLLDTGRFVHADMQTQLKYVASPFPQQRPFSRAYKCAYP